MNKISKFVVMFLLLLLLLSLQQAVVGRQSSQEMKFRGLQNK